MKIPDGQRAWLLSHITAQAKLLYIHIIFATARSPRQKWPGHHAAITGNGGKGTPKSMSCESSTRFMKLILLGLSLVRISVQRCTLQRLDYSINEQQYI